MFPLFSPKDFPQNVLQNFVKGLANVEHKVAIIRKWQAAIDSGKAANLKETQQDMFFLGDIFGEVLDYDYKGTEQWNLEVKPSTFVDATRPDAVLGLFKVGNETTPAHKFVKAVVELKGYRTTLDKKEKKDNDGTKVTPVGQAFSYVPKLGGTCSWVIVSNIECIRLYHASDMLRYQEFFVKDLLKNGNLEKFLFLLHKSRLFGQGEGTSPSLTDILYAERRAAEDRITIEFYNAYRDIREVLFFSLCKTNPEKSQLNILTATQKLIDRLIFICFARDVIPMANVLGDMKQAAANIYFEQDDFLWELLRKTFRSYNKGFSVKIPLFNGGLFADDEFLNSLLIKDFQLLPLVDFLLQHDFQSDLNVTILGHIFEQSIADLEQLKEQVTLHNGQLEEGKLESKRKIDGVFYTPDYITQYIVQHSVGAWLEEQKEILLEKYQTENKDFWTDYQNVLRSLRVLDPACGSGAFLVAVFNFLWVEWQMVLRELQPEKRNITSAEGLAFENSTQMWQIRKAIIENNLFGVDLNMESVEITKLSLWILQANKTVPLSDLSPNIKQGNSLIADKTVTEWAFDWQKEFPFQFDVVVGNPPYGAFLPPHHLSYYKENYESAEYQINSYVLFYEKSLALLNNNGYLGFITPNTFTYQHYFSKIRSIFNNYCIKTVSKNTFQVFPDANIGDTVNWIMKKAPQTDFVTVAIYDNRATFGESATKISFQDFRKNDNTYNTGNRIAFDKLCLDCENLGNLAQIIVGIKAYEEGAGKPKQTRQIVDNKPFTSNKKIDNTYIRCVIGKDFHRYHFIHTPPIFLSYGEWLAAPRTNAPFFEPTKIIIRQTADSLICHLDTFKYINLNNVYNVGRVDERLSIYYLLGLLNSKLLNYIYQDIAQEKGKLFAEVKKIYLEKLPIKVISLDAQQLMIEKVKQILLHYTSLSKIRIDLLELLESNFAKDKFSKKLENWFLLEWSEFHQEIEKIGIKMPLKKQKDWKEFFDEEQTTARQDYRAAQTLEKEINQLVYQLYNLTAEEIALIENEN